jgi:alkanesulfonate monooxygenase SsuD/methylene tetrahydromethanopterin reductase-like flavin-dependent oxidoreductase (luciferase family)
MLWGGGSLAAARRAGRYGLGYLAQGDVPGSQEAYEQACREHGHEPGMTLLPNRDTPSVCFVAPDVDLAWREIGEHLLHDARTYAEWNPGDQTTVGIADVSDVDELRATSRTHRIFTADEAIAYVRGGGMLTLAPLCGGITPDIAWKYLRYVDEAVMPALAAESPLPS